MLRALFRADDLSVLTMGASNDGLRVLDGLIHSPILNQNCDKNMSIVWICAVKTLSILPLIETVILLC